MGKLDLIPYVSVRVDEPKILLEPLLRRINSDLFDGNGFSVHIECGTVSEYQKHWAYDLAAREFSSDLSCSQECIVDIMMEHRPVAIDLFLSQCVGLHDLHLVTNIHI